MLRTPKPKGVPSHQRHPSIGQMEQDRINLIRNARQGNERHKEPLPSSKRVAIAFYGLTRSLTYTIRSMQQNVLQPLQKAGIFFDIYLHTYNLTTLTNRRSGENLQALNATEWKLLDPDFVSVTSQV